MPACALCRARGFSEDCLRCEGRRQLFRPLSQAERASREEQRSDLEVELVRRRAAESSRRERLLTLGRPVRVALVGCGRSKRPAAAAASELYTGALFRLAFAVASRDADEVFILSALHGLVAPDRVLAPYDLSLRHLRHRERRGWGHRVASALTVRYSGLRLELQLFAGELYASALRSHLPHDWTVLAPLAGLTLGKRLQWLSRQLGDAVGAGVVRRTE